LKKRKEEEDKLVSGEEEKERNDNQILGICIQHQKCQTKGALNLLI